MRLKMLQKKVDKLFQLFNFKTDLNKNSELCLEQFMNKIKKYELISIEKCYGYHFNIHIHHYYKSNDIFGGYFHEYNTFKETLKYDINDDNLYEKIFITIYDGIVSLYDIEILKKYMEYIDATYK